LLIDVVKDTVDFYLKSFSIAYPHMHTLMTFGFLFSFLSKNSDWLQDSKRIHTNKRQSHL